MRRAGFWAVRAFFGGVRCGLERLLYDSGLDSTGKCVMQLNCDEIQQIIPHRPPFLWLDEVVDVDEKRIVARKFVSPDLEVFRGHYPHFPILPGVLICEAIFQAAAVLIGRMTPTGSTAVPVATRIQGAQFRRMVRPGETMQLEVDLTERLANAVFFKGRAVVDGQVAVRVEFACAEAAMGS